MPNYVQYSEQEVRELMEDMQFQEVRVGGTRELVFELPTKQPDVRLRVYSSVAAGSARGCGKDAGRVVLVVKNGHGDWHVAWKARRVHRTENFLANLRKRCRDAWLMVARMPRCPSCGGRMVVRRKRGARGKRSEFWGCMQYPRCRGTRRL